MVVYKKNQSSNWSIIKNLFTTKSKTNFTTTCNEAENIAKANKFCDYFLTVVKSLKPGISLFNCIYVEDSKFYCISNS